MQKFLFFITTFFICSSSFALNFEIRGKKQIVAFNQDFKLSLPRSVGDITIEVLEKNNIPFEGSAEGLSSLLGLSNEMEILSDQEMKAYGCVFHLMVRF